MFSENIVHIVAGTLVIAGTALGVLVSQWFLIIPAFVGLNLIQYGFSNFCPMEIIMRKVGLSSAHKTACSMKDAVEQQ
mgnify:CR=1 FL=1